jgi:hypothetical protein
LQLPHFKEGAGGIIRPPLAENLAIAIGAWGGGQVDSSFGFFLGPGDCILKQVLVILLEIIYFRVIQFSVFGKINKQY